MSDSRVDLYQFTPVLYTLEKVYTFWFTFIQVHHCRSSVAFHFLQTILSSLQAQWTIFVVHFLLLWNLFHFYRSNVRFNIPLLQNFFPLIKNRGHFLQSPLFWNFIPLYKNIAYFLVHLCYIMLSVFLGLIVNFCNLGFNFCTHCGVRVLKVYTSSVHVLH